jgi:hypothetical protein
MTFVVRSKIHSYSGQIKNVRQECIQIVLCRVHFVFVDKRQKRRSLCAGGELSGTIICVDPHIIG